MRVFLGLGSNLGDRLANLGEALRCIDEVPDVVLVAVSHAYESVAWPAEEDPPYANAVVLVESELELVDLLAQCADIEREMGRDQLAPRNAPRVIDIDILLAGWEEWERPELTVPHPRLAERDFAITPLLELDPNAQWPDGTPVTREHVTVGRITAVLGVIPGFEALTPGGEDVERPAVPPTPARVREPLPGDEWVEVLRHPEGMDAGGLAALPVVGSVPPADAGFIEVVLTQEGIPFTWDPYSPGEVANPYNLTRPYRLLVPASMAPDAKRIIDEATEAPFDLSEAYELAEEAEAESEARGEDEE